VESFVPRRDAPSDEAKRPSLTEQRDPASSARDDLIAYGAESDTERRVKRIVPWIVSAMVHLSVILLGFALTWTVVLLQRDEPPARIVADFNAMMYEPVARLGDESTDAVEPMVRDRVIDDLDDASVADRLRADVDPSDLLADAADRDELARFAPEPSASRASFVGLSSTNARSVVYVIDASGSMLGAFPIVIDELARSLENLTPQQEFAVMFFQQNRALVVPPPNRLVPGTSSNLRKVLAWIDENVIPVGRSNPLEALERALRLDPDVIFLLSENITGSGEFEIDQADLLQLLDELNPVDRDLGRRRTQINCIQFLDPDPLDTLRKIAREHGGPDGYKFLDRAELGLKQR
jgi:hypothetical protein